MFLTEANVLHYLLERRFADLDAVVDGAFTVRHLSRRNQNFHVSCGGREYLVKQVKKWKSESRASLAREAAFYWQAKTDPRYEPLTALAPRSYAWDPPNAVLILEFLTEHTELYDMPDRFAPGLARLAGAAMGAFHRNMEQYEMAPLFPGGMPWQLSMHQVKEEDLEDPSGGQCELLRVVKKYPEFGLALDWLHAEWRDETVIHGDWKLDNCLISPNRDRLRVVDWEFACWSDSCWDVGTLLQSYWNFWVRWPSRYRIAEIQPALRAFLEAYARARGCDTEEVAARAIRFAGARMLQTAYELMVKAGQLSADTVRLMQASFNVLTRPEWAAGQFLGMESKCMAN